MPKVTKYAQIHMSDGTTQMNWLLAGSERRAITWEDC
jgi:hypothetical protein